MTLTGYHWLNMILNTFKPKYKTDQKGKAKRDIEESIMRCFSRFLIVAMLRSLPLPTEWLESVLEGRQAARKAGTFAMSFFVYKVLGPLRIGATIVLTPYFYRVIKGRNLVIKKNLEKKQEKD